MSRRRGYRIFVWRSLDELNSIKHAFFPAPDGPDDRAMAVSRVRAWTVRGRIPHAIEATAMLTEAVLHDVPGASQLNLRLSISAAICRFVNGLLDPAQQSQFALPMHTLARNLNLPASFVELRHAATHESLPSINVLRTGAGRALTWLWDNYWASIGNAEVIEEEEKDEDAQICRARAVLKRWRDLRRKNPEMELDRYCMEAKEALRIVKECVGMCKDIDRIEVFVDAMLEEKVLVPAGKKKISLMNNALRLWQPLLEPLDASIKGFAETLLTSMLETFKASPTSKLPSSSTPPSSSSPSFTEFNEIILSWLKHLTTPDTKSKFGKTVNIEELVKGCILSPNEWNLRLLNHLLKTHPSLPPKYIPIARLAESQVFTRLSTSSPSSSLSAGATGTTTTSTTPNVKKRSIQEVETELDAFETRFAEMKQRQKQQQEQREQQQREQQQREEEKRIEKEGRGGYRWRPWEGDWVARPIGVV